MKTPESIHKEIDELKKPYFDEKGRFLSGVTETAPYKKAFKRIEFLITCLRYLESNPKESFIQDEITRIQNRIFMITECEINDKGKEVYLNFEIWKKNNPDRCQEGDPFSNYKTDMKLTHLKNQLSTLNYIMGYAVEKEKKPKKKKVSTPA